MMRYKMHIKYGEYIITRNGKVIETHKIEKIAADRLMKFNDFVKKSALQEVMKKEKKGKPKQK